MPAYFPVRKMPQNRLLYEHRFSRFFAPVYPGDQMVSHIGLPPSKSRFGKGSGEITVNGKLVMKITLMFAIVDGAK